MGKNQLTNKKEDSSFLKKDIGINFQERSPEQNPLLGLQQGFGNQSLNNLLNNRFIQTKLKVNSPGDKYEKEADHVADSIVKSGFTTERPLVSNSTGIQRKCSSCAGGGGSCSDCTGEDEIRRKEKSNEQMRAEETSDLFDRGSSLSPKERKFYEPRFGADFSHVKIHTGSKANESAGNLNARAFTLGNNIAFGKGEYSPHTTEGKRLIAHELTHVVQQTGTGNKNGLISKSNPQISRTPQDCAKMVETKQHPTDKLRKCMICISKLKTREEKINKLEEVFSSLSAKHPDWSPGMRKNLRKEKYPLRLYFLKNIMNDTGVLSRMTNIMAKAQSGAVPDQSEIPSTKKGTAPANPTKGVIPGGGTEVKKIGIIYKTDGANIRNVPDSTKKPIKTLPMNERVFVIKSFSNGLSFVSTEDGLMGYVFSNRIKTNLPEPNAKIHKVKSGETALGIALKYYGGHATTGSDQRDFVNVLLLVNNGEGDSSKGIYTDKKVENERDRWGDVKVRENYLIWIPSVSFAKGLVGTKLKPVSIKHKFVSALKGFGQGMKDILDSMVQSKKYMWAAIKKQLTQALWDVLYSLAILLIGAAGILIISTAIGAIVSGGAGAAVGFKVGLAILKWVGLALLIAWIASEVIKIGSAFWTFLKTAWNANGDKLKIDQAAKYFADAIAVFLAFLLQVIIFYAIKVGSVRSLSKLKGTRFGKWIGGTRLGKWLSDQLTGVERAVPEAARGKKFGPPSEGYFPQGPFMTWLATKMSPEGWKLHVSANPGSSPKIAEIVLPVLRKMNVNHKVIESPEALAKFGGKPGSPQSGKFITIYPKDNAQALQIVKAIDPLLAGKGLKGPKIAGEKPVGSSGLIYTRYGVFVKGHTLVDPRTGKPAKDPRGQKFKPDWVKDNWKDVKGPKNKTQKVSPVPKKSDETED